MPRFALLALILLAACANPAGYSPAPDLPGAQATAADAQRQLELLAQRQAAQQATQAAAISQATQQAVDATRQAEAIAQATAQSAAATSTALSETLAGQMTAQSIAIVGTQASIAAGATADAVAIAAIAEQRMVEDEAARLANQREQEQIANDRRRTMAKLAPWLYGGAVLALVLFAGAMAYRLYNLSRPVNIHTGNGQMVTALPSNRYQIYTPRPRELPPPEPEPEERPQLASNAIMLPERLPSNMIGLGASPERALWYDQAQLSDMLIVGNKGSGKSSFLRMLAYQAYMAGWKLFLADAEMLTFDPDVWGQVAHSEANVLEMLDVINGEFERRFTAYREAFRHMSELPAGQQFFVEDLTNYNKAAARFGLQSLPPMMLLWDEANSHLDEREIRQAIRDIVRRSRKPGMTVAIAGHEWHAVSVPKIVSGRLDRRIAFRTDAQSSQIVLGDKAAAHLPHSPPGRALMRERGELQPVQTFYLPAPRILRDVRPNGEAVTGQWEEIRPRAPQPAYADPKNLDDATRERIRRLIKELPSQAAVERAVFGYDGGAAWQAVRDVLNNTTNGHG